MGKTTSNWVIIIPGNSHCQSSHYIDSVYTGTQSIELDLSWHLYYAREEESSKRSHLIKFQLTNHIQLPRF